jgi:Ca2+-binding RTX toxin-like protein
MISLALLFTTLMTVTTYQAGLAISKICTGGPCIGTIGDDKLIGSDVFDDMDGLRGDDSLDARGGDDVVFGDFGNDKIIGGSGDDGIDASFGNDKVDGGTGNDRLEGDFGVDTLVGGEGDDTIWQFRSSNLPDGSKDVISCGPGEDTAYISLEDDDFAADDCEHVITDEFS